MDEQKVIMSFQRIKVDMQRLFAQVDYLGKENAELKRRLSLLEEREQILMKACVR